MIKYINCCNPECGILTPKLERAQKYCSYQCGDAYRAKNYRLRNLQRIKERRLKRRDHIWGVQKAWAARNRDKIQEYNRKASLKGDKVLRKIYMNEWAATHRARIKSYAAARRSNLKFGYTIVTDDEWDMLVSAWEGCCAYCRAQGNLTQDHIVPLSKGGLHTLDNILPACRKCNSTKCTKDLGDFLVELYAELGCNPWKMPK